MAGGALRAGKGHLSYSFGAKGAICVIRRAGNASWSSEVGHSHTAASSGLQRAWTGWAGR